MTNDDEYLTEHWLFLEKDEFQEFIKQERQRLNDSFKDVKPFDFRKENNANLQP